MKLYLMRHGQAAGKLQDPEQGLTETGRADIERLAYQLADRGMTFSRGLHSDKTRARQTAETMARIIAPDAALSVHDHLKPNDDPVVLLAEMDDWQEDTLVTSHLPYLPGLLALLPGNTGATQAIGFEPGTVVCLAKDGETAWRFKWTASP